MLITTLLIYFPVWFIENCELPGFSAAILNYTIEFECHDKYGSSDTGSLYVIIKPNETPTFLNLDGKCITHYTVIFRPAKNQLKNLDTFLQLSNLLKLL